jgi:hypothetical protein
MKKIVLFMLFACLLAVPVLFAQELPDVFPLFLAVLAERHEEVEILAMPDVEILTAPGFEDEAI